MLSSLLILSIKESMWECFKDNNTSNDKEPIEEEDVWIENLNNEDELDNIHIPVATDEDSQVVKCNQIHHYIYYSQLLADMCFYKFCCCIWLQTKT